MPEGQLHKRIKRLEAGGSGQTEVPLPDGRRLDAVRGDTAYEVETHPSPDRLLEDAKRLKASRRRKRVLVVPKPKQVPAAAKALRKAGTTGTARTPRRPKAPPARKIRVSRRR